MGQFPRLACRRSTAEIFCREVAERRPGPHPSHTHEPRRRDALSPGKLERTSQRAASPARAFQAERKTTVYGDLEAARTSGSGSARARARDHTKLFGCLLTSAACEFHLDKKEKHATKKGIYATSTGKPVSVCFLMDSVPIIIGALPAARLPGARRKLTLRRRPRGGRLGTAEGSRRSREGD